MLKHHAETDPEYDIANNNAFIFLVFIIIVFFSIVACAFMMPQPKYDKPVLDVRIIRDEREQQSSDTANSVIYRQW
jgi:hypothetical protein